MNILKSGKFSKACVRLMFASIFAFTIAMVILFARYQSVPEPLIVAFFAFWGVEGGAMAWIKNCETKHKTKKKKVEDKDNGHV